MNMMFTVGTVCWIMEIITLGAFLYVCRDTTDLKGYILKGAASTTILLYGLALILIHSREEGHPVSEASVLFMTGLFFAFVGDMALATMQLRYDGSSKALFEKMSLDHVTIYNLTFGVVGVLFILSFFFELVAFVKGIHGNVQEYAVPFLLLSLLPILFTVIGGMLAQFRIPEVSTKIFIIMLFYILLTSALFGAIAVYAFWMYSQDPQHATFVSIADTLFALSVLMIALRYSRPDRFETRSFRALSRILNYMSRMMLAGCAFLF